MKTWSRELSAPLDNGRTAHWFDPPLSVNAAEPSRDIGFDPHTNLFFIFNSFFFSLIYNTIYYKNRSSYYRKFILITFWVLCIISSTADILDWFVSMIETSDDKDEPCRTSSEVSIMLDSFENI